MTCMPPETMMTSGSRDDSRTESGGGSGSGGGVGRGNRAAMQDLPVVGYRPNGTVPPSQKQQDPHQHHPHPRSVPSAPHRDPHSPYENKVPPGGRGRGTRHATHPHQNPGAFAMPPGGDIVESPEPSGAEETTERTPMLRAGDAEGPRPPSYRENPEPGTVSISPSSGRAPGIHTPSETGSPAHSASSPGSPTLDPLDPLAPVTMAGLRPLSQPPSYEDVLREDHRGVAGLVAGRLPPVAGPPSHSPHPGASLGLGVGVLEDDDHFESRYSDSD